jgi:hypothetical protein
MIFRRSLTAALFLLSFVGAAAAQQPALPPFPKEPQLQWLTREEANSIIMKLRDAQDKVRAREALPFNFELLSGSWANHAMAELPPREAFLQLRMETILTIEKQSTDTLWQPFRMSFMPEGLGRRYWEVTVFTGTTGRIERVMMVYKNPAPF